MINHKCSCDSSVQVFFENSSGVVLLLAKQLKAALTNGTRYYMFSEDGVNKVTLKIEFLYIEIKHFHFMIFLVNRCKYFHRL